MGGLTTLDPPDTPIEQADPYYPGMEYTGVGAGTPRKVILDTDPGVDDALALLFAASVSELEVVAITSCAGNVDVERATQNARLVAGLAWDVDSGCPQVHRGADLQTVTAEHVHGEDGLGGTTEATENWRRRPGVSPVTAVDAVHSLVTECPGEITWVCLGPLTNAAEFFETYPEAARLLKEIIVMGGAFQEPGNVTATAEFNIYCNPDAARTLLQSGLPLRWVPTDVTQRIVFTEAHLERLEECRFLPLMRQMLGAYMDFHETGYGVRGCFLHDPIAVALAAWPQLGLWDDVRIDVETRGELTRGMTVLDSRPSPYRDPESLPNARVCVEANTRELLRRILNRLSRQSVDSSYPARLD